MGPDAVDQTPGARGSAPLISVILPVHNGAMFLADSVRSVLRQTVTDLELIIVDDASTDGSASVAHACAIRDARVTVVVRPVRGGPSAARNTGLDTATGTRVVFVDADDRLLPGAIEALAGAMPVARHGIAIGGHRVTGWSAMGGVHRPRDYRPASTRITLGSAATFRRYARGRLPSVVWAAMFSRNLFDGLRFADLSPHSDAEIMPRLIRKADRITLIPDPVYAYQRRPGSVVDALHPSRLNSIRVQKRLLSLCSLPPHRPLLRSYGRRAVIASAFGLAAFVAQKQRLGAPVDLRDWHIRIRREADVSALLRWVLWEPWLPPFVRIRALGVALGPRPALWVYRAREAVARVKRLVTP